MKKKSLATTPSRFVDRKAGNPRVLTQRREAVVVVAIVSDPHAVNDTPLDPASGSRAHASRNVRVSGFSKAPAFDQAESARPQYTPDLVDRLLLLAVVEQLLNVDHRHSTTSNDAASNGLRSA